MSEGVELPALHLDVNDRSPEEAVHALIEHAASVNASDLFFVSNETHVAVHVRHLGLLRLVSILPPELGRRCMSHVKASAGLDVAERRRPQDGRWIVERASGARIDLRINTIPTLYGEDFTFRLLDRNTRLLNLEQIGLLRHDHNRLVGMLNNPSGLILVDKRAGPSSFQVIAAIRRRTGARTGHAGTLDPFASGLLLVLSGAATRLARWLVGLDKRYVTDVDLGARTSTGDVEGEVVEETPVPARAELEQRLAALRGEVELPVPAASAVKIEGERAYRLHRRGQVVEMPVRRSLVSTLELLDYQDGVARLDLRVGSGTYIRSIADVLGGHCRTLRRLEVGPFAVDDADDERILPAAEALPFLPAVEVSAEEAAAIRAGRRRAPEDTRTISAGELVAVGRVVMPE